MMLTNSLPLFSVVLAATASQVVLQDLLDGAGSQPADFEKLYQAYPDYSLDLSAKRLVQLSTSDPPVILTELDKVLLENPEIEGLLKPELG